MSDTADEDMFVERQDTREAHGRRHAERGRSARVGVVMVQRDEERLLDPWLRYHGYVFGPENIAVVDEGSRAPAVLERLEQAEADGVAVVRDAGAAEGRPAGRRGRVVRDRLREFERRDYDFLMPLDCDEFVAFMGTNGRVECTPDAVLNHLNAEHRDAPKVLAIRGSYLNLPGTPGFYFFRNERRVFFARGAMGDLADAYQRGTSPRAEGLTETSLIHFHYRFRPYALLDDAARADLDRPGDDFVAEGLRHFKGKVAGPVPFRDMDEAQYHAFFRRFDRLPLSSLRAALRRLGSDLPY